MDNVTYAIVLVGLVIVLPTLLMIAWFIWSDSKHEKERAKKKEQKRLKKSGLANSQV